MDIISKYSHTFYGTKYIKNNMLEKKDLDFIKKENNILNYFLELWNQDKFIDLRGTINIEEIILKLEDGYHLEPKEFRNIAIFHEQLHTIFRENYKNLQQEILEIFEKINYYKELTKRILKTIDIDGNIYDKATERLFEIRKKLNKIKSRSTNVINNLLNKHMKYLSIEQPVTKNDRICLAVKQENRKNVPGFVIGRSDSGATLFIEPEQVASLNEEYAVMKDSERSEISKILTDLRLELKTKIKQMRKNIDLISYIDSFIGRIRFLIDNNAKIITPNEKTTQIKFDGLKHLLIPKDIIVPLYINMNKKGMIITGPNTGGKTVTLKSVGLAFFMSHVGLPVLCEGAKIPYIENIYTDIGDEQNITQNLSTFSSHLQNLKRIIYNSGENDLILIDELGTGTDPIEGAALGKSIIERIINQKSYLFTTSHLSEIKTYSMESNDLISASMSFNVDTLSPTYILLMGVPGASHAIEIAKRMGFDDNIIDNAKKNIDEDIIKHEKMFSKISNVYEEIQKNKENQRLEKYHLEKLKNDYEIKLEKVKNKEIEKVDKEIKQIRMKIDKIKKDLEITVSVIKKATKENDLKTLKENMKKLDDIKSDINYLNTKDYNKKSKNYIIEKDMFVRVPGGDEGKVVKIENSKAIIKLKTSPIELTYDKNELIPIIKKEEKKKVYVNTSYNKKIKAEIDIRGFTVNEAIPEIEKLISDMISNSISEGYIIHGKGTGKLSLGVWDYLRGTKRIKNFRLGKSSEGGTGVTVLEV